MDLSVRLPRHLTLKNPIIAASGTFGFGPEYAHYVNINELGGISVKGISPDPWRGNPPPRVWETPSGLLNSIGLQNPGMEVFLQEDIPFLETVDTTVIANIIGHTVDEYARVAERLSQHGRIDALEVNISCPNIKEGGVSFGHDAESAYRVMRAVRQVSDKPVMVKLSPNLAEPWVIAEAVIEAGADIISAINTLVGMAIDLTLRRPALGGRTGGLSGPAIKPIALRVVYEIASRFDVPIIGMGGIQSAQDVLEFLMAGAQAVMVGTITFQHPQRMAKIIGDLPGVLAHYGFSSLNEAVGVALQGGQGD